jgi:hypothetical protein
MLEAFGGGDAHLPIRQLDRLDAFRQEALLQAFGTYYCLEPMLSTR